MTLKTEKKIFSPTEIMSHKPIFGIAFVLLGLSVN